MSNLRLAKIAAAAAAALATVPAWADAWVSSGAAASYVDVTKLVRESIDARTIENMRGERADGGSIWLDVKGAVTKADKAVAGTSGWDNDVYAANLGADIKKGDSFFGVVYTYANVDGKSKGTGAPIDTDINFWGVSAFGQQTFGAMSVFGSAGWMYVTGDVSGAGAKSDMDGNIWTADIGVKGAANFGALSLGPYAKAELTYLAPENFAGGEPDNLRIYQFPVGVKIKVQPPDHIQLAFGGVGGGFLVFGLGGEFADHQFRHGGLVLDDIGPGLLGHPGHLLGQFQAAVVVHARLGDDADAHGTLPFLLVLHLAAHGVQLFRGNRGSIVRHDRFSSVCSFSEKDSGRWFEIRNVPGHTRRDARWQSQNTTHAMQVFRPPPADGPRGR